MTECDSCQCDVRELNRRLGEAKAYRWRVAMNQRTEEDLRIDAMIRDEEAHGRPVF